MKKGIHPENYRPVVFKDMSNGDMFLSRSTCATKDTAMAGFFSSDRTIRQYNTDIWKL